MKYIDTSGVYRIGIIPRKTMLPIIGEDYSAFLYDETTKQIIEVGISNVFEDTDIFYFDVEFNVVENTFYELTIIGDTQKIIYKDRLYCTDENITDFSINVGMYNSLETNNNNYITI